MQTESKWGRHRLVALLAVAAAAVPIGIRAQAPDSAGPIPEPLCQALETVGPTTLASPLDDLRRLAEISGCVAATPRTIRRAGHAAVHASPGSTTSDDAAFAARLLPVELAAVDRTGYPDDRNNGALWEGVGVSSALRGGLHLRAPYVSAMIRPELLYHQNEAFPSRVRDRIGYSPFASVFYGGVIDYPRRFGADAWWELVPGDSYVRVDVAGLAAGVSTENLWRGPALRYPILMSSTAPGFAHAFLGTSGPVDVFIGAVHAELVWGRLTESDYFDEIPGNDETGIVVASAEFEPRWLRGLVLGGTRSYLYRPPADGLDPVLGTIGVAITENRPGNGLASLYARWVFEDAGAEVYAEWAREDVLGTWPEFLQEPDHSQAYLFGAQKVTRVSSKLALRVHAELVALQEKGEIRTNSRPRPVYYVHSTVRQGYTHRGQLLGAGIGPGSDAQFVAVDALFSGSTVGAYFERVRRWDLTADALVARRWAPFEHDTEVLGGVRGLLLRAPFSFSADVSHSYRYNRDFRDDDRNTRIEVRLGWSPELGISR